jgi:simple sugar transport system permease protein
MTSGRGWIAIALVIFGTWDPIVVLFGALLFGFVDGLNFQLQSVGVPVSTHLLAMMPYAFTLIVLVFTWTRLRYRRVGMPEALGVPYEREAR